MHDVRLLVKDNFLPDPERVRQEVLARDFKDEIGPDGGVYKHIQLRPVNEFSEFLSAAVGRPVKQSLTMVRASYAGEEPHCFVHSDQICAEFASVLYLNEPSECSGGTAFWQHLKTGWISLPTEAAIKSRGKSPKREYAKVESDWNVEDAWEKHSFVEMAFNRFVTYPSRRFHSRYPQTSFEGRLIWVSFYDV